eukprot:TRINITY_DN68470_c0_g1_i1.p2 TRINITY_DN68470_c0_g1~~TRINITY_DN68470_c0_g1_i1.p2  ORF type:complete len:308 (+),score=189.04 TRINITY_DN68470_c0_g1_i1:94-1017(+)
MGFVKVQKNRAYYKRYQVKFRRRRACKTDYAARKALVLQDKNKYGSPKYRLVVRITNRDVVCQIFSSDLTHDVCLAAAYSHELPRYGIKAGLTNYAACYATGLLLARRVNAKLNLDYEGQTEVDGEFFLVEKDGEKGPFRALLDVGLARTSTGARVFGALKGAVDGGLDVPHNDRRFPGSYRDEETKEYASQPDVHRNYIFGGHVKTYMEHLQENDEEAYKRQFSKFIAAGVGPDDLEDMYAKAHAAIRADPFVKRGSNELGYFKTRKGAKPAIVKKSFKRAKISNAQRRSRIQQILTARGVEAQPL